MNHCSATPTNSDVGTTYISAPTTDTVSKENHTHTPFSLKEHMSYQQDGKKPTGTVLQNEHFTLSHCDSLPCEEGGENVQIHEFHWHLITALSKVSSCVTHLLSPNSQQRREEQFLRSCYSRNSLSLALKNPLRKSTASTDIENRQCCVRCSHRRWTLFHTPTSSQEKRWKSYGCHCCDQNRRGYVI